MGIGRGILGYFVINYDGENLILNFRVVKCLNLKFNKLKNL